MDTNNKLVEMIETENGYTLNNLSPFFLHNHIYDMLEKTKSGLLIYTELQKICTIDNTAVIIQLIRTANNIESARQDLASRFNISKETAQHILDMQLDELSMFGAYDYQSSINMYKEAVSSMSKLAQMQYVIDSLNVD